jgi:NAD(P)-dependent dehydrogenase (short-subunit alcohol dehydrogenase family)
VKAIYSPANMGEPMEIASMISLAEKTFGRVDVLVNNAGIQHVSPIEDFPVEKWDAVIAINLSSAFHAIRAVTPGMKQRGWGRIINTASAHSLVASPFKSAYVAAKHGIAGLTKTVALELAQSRITCISPRITAFQLTPRKLRFRGCAPQPAPLVYRSNPKLLLVRWRWYYFGRPGFYGGRYNGGSFGPCWTRTPIGPIWNCG